jgi:lipoate-protein ligase A
VKTIINDSLDPRYNLALEEYVSSNNSTPKKISSFCAQNANSVIIGRNQNTIEEVNAAYVASPSSQRRAA